CLAGRLCESNEYRPRDPQPPRLKPGPALQRMLSSILEFAKQSHIGFSPHLDSRLRPVTTARSFRCRILVLVLPSCFCHHSRIQMKTVTIFIACSFWAALQIHAAFLEGWTAVAPREEIRPRFEQSETGGKSGHGVLSIRADEREGL